MIQLHDICFAYDETPVLSHFNMEVARGEFVVIKGDNGCGKTTLLGIINALLFPEKGTYLFDGTEITKKSTRVDKVVNDLHRRIGYVFQNTEVQLFCPTVEDELAFAPRQTNLTEEEIRTRVDDVLRLLEIEHLRRRAPYQLSMGEKKKVALGAVLTVNPEVLILDEPMNFLDKKSREWLTAFLLKMKAAGKTILVVSHTDDFDALCDRILSM